MNLSRRNMLKAGVGTAALWASGVDPLGCQSLSALARSASKKIPIALQLYSVREACAKDLPPVLQAVAEMGYEGVEFAGYYGRKAPELRRLLDANGLKCCGTHIALDALLGEALKGTVEFNKILGNEFLIVSGMPHERRNSAPATKDTAKLFDELAEKVKADKMRVGYHAHGGDFERFDGETAWDILFGNTRPEVVMQMDIGNCIGGGGDPIATLKKFPGRSATIHLKEHGGKSGAAIGEGDVKWDEVFKLCETTGGTQWYIVEQESYAQAPLESVKRCLQNLRKMGK